MAHGSENEPHRLDMADRRLPRGGAVSSYTTDENGDNIEDLFRNFNEVYRDIREITGRLSVLESDRLVSLPTYRASIYVRPSHVVTVRPTREPQPRMCVVVLFSGETHKVDLTADEAAACIRQGVDWEAPEVKA